MMSDSGNNAELIQTHCRVLSWNLWWRYGPWQARRPAIIATLANLDADIIGLQEIWRDDETNFAAELARELGYHHVFHSTHERDGLGFGNAILSRWPIKQHDSIAMKSQRGGNTRGVLFAEIDGPRGIIPAFCTHLSWRYQHSHIRQQQVTDLAHFVASKQPGQFPPLVCGDFNAEPMSEEIRMMTGLTTCPVEELFFHDVWRVAGAGSNHQESSAGFTWENTNPYALLECEPNRRIDYIFVGHPGAGGAGHVTDCQVVGNQPVDDIWPSDHHALLAKLRY